jgi:hypothetical protein
MYKNVDRCKQDQWCIRNVDRCKQDQYYVTYTRSRSDVGRILLDRRSNSLPLYLDTSFLIGHSLVVTSKNLFGY